MARPFEKCFIIAIIAVCFFALYSLSHVSKRFIGQHAQPTRRVVQYYLQQSHARRDSMLKILKENTDDYWAFYHTVVPEVFCAEWPRVGRILDGGKWMCAPHKLVLSNTLNLEITTEQEKRTEEKHQICNSFLKNIILPDNCVILSLGLHNEVSFEQELQKLSNKRCRILAYDMDEQSPLTKEVLKDINAKPGVAFIANVTDPENNNVKEIGVLLKSIKRENFPYLIMSILATSEKINERMRTCFMEKKTMISGLIDQMFTLEHLMRSENVRAIEILKMDIEGAELDVLPEFLDHYQVAQIMVEVHGPPREMATLLKAVSHKGYWLSSREINGRFHNVSEFSFIHESAFERYGASPLARFLDV